MGSTENGFAKVRLMAGRNFAVLAVLAVALALRIYFFVGISCSDDAAYIEEVHRILTGGGWYAGGNVVADRWGVFYPMAVLSLVFGLSEWTLSVWPLACSLMEIAAVYALGRRLHSPACGFLAALLLCFFPPHILLATRTMPDGILAGFWAVAVLLFVAGRDREASQRPAAWMLYGAAGFLTGCSSLAKMPGLFLMLPFAFVGLVDLVCDRRFPRFAVPLCAGLAAVLAGQGFIHYLHGGSWTQSYTAVSELYTDDYLMSVHNFSLWYYPEYLLRDGYPELPMGLNRVVIAAGLLCWLVFSRPGRRGLIVCAWLVLVGLYMEFGSQSVRAFLPINKEYRYVSMIYAPAAVMAGAGFVACARAIFGFLCRRRTVLARTLSGIFLTSLSVFYATAAIPPTQDSCQVWMDTAPPCAGCKSAAINVRDSLLKMPERLVYAPTGPSSSLLRLLLLADGSFKGTLECLMFSPDTPDPLPVRNEPYLMVHNLDTRIFIVNQTDTYRLPAWVRNAPAGWQLVADLGSQPCPDARPRIYRVMPGASAAAGIESPPHGATTRAPQDAR
jgi:hypothetical protein